MPHASIEAVHNAVVGTTAPQMFLKLAAARPDLPALHSMRSDAPGSWNVWTLHDYVDATAKAAAGLQVVGLGPNERILLMVRNRPEFHWFDLAAQFLRATPVSIYNSSSAEEVQYLAEHAEARIAIIEDIGFLERLLSVRDQLPVLEQIYVIDPPSNGCPVGVQPASVLMDKGSADLAALATLIEPDDIATLIYTSGTTGPPKGVIITHYNVVYTVEALRQCFGLDSFAGRRVVSYLPMAHIAERMMSHYQAIILGYSVFCCPDANQLSSYLKEVHPEIVFGVPRVWEKIYNGVNAALASDPA
ncbi:MAG TPA: AMP-binding protein, partial [Ilumatobacteraceae bacterium]|nr:AMP-binding protein [Ilumatobacteraceae bacterium]